MSMKTTVNIKDTARFKHMPLALVYLLDVLVQAARNQGIVATITGASYEAYKKGSYHDRGYAWDVRIKDIPHSLAYVCFIRSTLKDIDEKYRVVYGDANHTDHIHIEYRYDRKAK